MLEDSPIHVSWQQKKDWDVEKEAGKGRKRGTSAPFGCSNWLDWKIQREIMRIDMSKLCWRWKAWGHQECFKKCSRASRLNGAYFHGNHTKSNLSAPPPPHLLDAWPWLVLRQTKLLLSSPCKWWGASQFQSNHTCIWLPPLPPRVYPLLVFGGGVIIPRAIVCLSIWLRWNQGFRYKNHE